jgi:hypothetical protein
VDRSLPAWSLALGLIASSAHAAAPVRNRFHIVSDKLMSHLSSGAQKNERAIVAFPKATGFVVGTDKANPKRILIMTNFHVAGEGPPAGDVHFRDGTNAHPIRTVVANPALDYALVEAELSDGPRAAGVEAMTIDRRDRPMAPRRALYVLGGHTGLGTGVSPEGKERELGNTLPRRSIAGGQAVEDNIKTTIAANDAAGAGPTGWRTIAVGRVKRTSKDVERIKVGSGETLGIESTMPNARGMSGAPVLDREKHTVVGLHFGGFGPTTKTWTQSTAPINLILRDLGHKLERGQVSGNADLVQQLVDGT